MSSKWSDLHFGPLTRKEIAEAVKDEDWQLVREELLLLPLEERLSMLRAYLANERYSRKAKVRVTNYINALRRGGMIK